MKRRAALHPLVYVDDAAAPTQLVWCDREYFFTRGQGALVAALLAAFDVSPVATVKGRDLARRIEQHFRRHPFRHLIERPARGRYRLLTPGRRRKNSHF